jgi:DNA-binding transcriptional ArsR family regulator
MTAATKTPHTLEEGPPTLERRGKLNEAFKALADPTRREILRLLRGGERSAGELAELLERRLSKPTVSHHFAVLRAADLVGSRKEGQQVYYFLNTTVVEDLLAMIWGLFSADGDGPAPEG